MELTIDGVVVSMPGLEPAGLAVIHTRLEDLLSQPKVKNREAIANAFTYGIELCSDINPSDLWHHVTDREFTRTIAAVHRVNEPKQSWGRSNGRLIFADESSDMQLTRYSFF